MEGATNLGLPEPLIWMRWHPHIDQEFFEFCLTRIARSTCFPLMWNDKVVPDGLMALGVSRADAYNYIPVGCNELGIPGQFYFNPGRECQLPEGDRVGAHRWQGIQSAKLRPLSRSPQLSMSSQRHSEAHLRGTIRASYEREMKQLRAQMKWGQTPLTSCFFEGCVEKGHDLTAGTKYNILSCGGIFFANAVDSLAAIRQVVYEKR